MPTTARSRRLRPLALPAALLLSISLAACGETTEPDLDVIGSVKFDYSGAMTGSFTAAGDLPLDAAGIPTSIPGSAAAAIVRPAGMTLVGVRGVGNGEGDVLVLHIGNFTGVGSYAMDMSTCGNPDDPSGCRIGAFMPAASLAELRQATELGPLSVQGVFLIATGTVTVTEYSARTDGRIRGTFSVVGAMPPSTGFSSVTITNGQFELPVRPAP